VGARVLVVEDQPLNMELAVAILENNGYEVWTASDAKECLTVLQKGRPDIILMDIQMPGTDGLELTRILRADAATHDLLIVAMTAHAMEEDADRVRAAGCDGYLIKPIQTRLLAQQIAGFLAQKTGADSKAMQESRVVAN
jgi:CheY-like chemotaxis protein